LCMECCTKFVEKDGSYNGKTIRKKDVVALQRSGTGFVGSGTQIEAKRFEHLGIGSGLADVRGQSAGPSSKFGLVYR
jgi:nitric oxide synthase-interacting protein